MNQLHLIDQDLSINHIHDDQEVLEPKHIC